MNEPKRRRAAWPWLFFPLLGILIAILGILGVPQRSSLNYPANTQQVFGQFIGQTAPDFTAMTLDGKKIRLSQRRGAVIAISFWASWCEPCKTELPEFQKASIKYSPGQFIILAVNTGEPEKTVQQFVSELQLSIPVLLDPDQVIKKDYSVSVLPITFWVDRNGIVQQEQIGAVDMVTIERYITLLDSQP